MNIVSKISTILASAKKIPYCNTGKLFEQSFKDMLESLDYNEIEKPNNVPTGKRHLILKTGQFMHEPNGSQQAPDFVVNVDGVFQAFELKNSKSGNPMWNCGIPQENYFYIINGQAKEEYKSIGYTDTTFRVGKDFCSERDRKTIPQANKLIKGYADEVYNLYGIENRSIYIRVNQDYDVNEKGSLVNSDKRFEMEKSAIDYANSICYGGCL